MKKIVTIGGGTGTFVVLSGLKRHEGIELSAIVSVADDGGSTGRLRDAYGFLPLGDLRLALIALSNDETMLRKLLSYRFSKGDVTGHNFGNLYLTALSEMLGSDRRAITEAARMLNVTGTVLPVSNTAAILCAEYENGECVAGESSIEKFRKKNGPIKRLYLEEERKISEEAQEAIRNADLIVLGPGDIFTSTLANFAVKGVSQAVRSSSARLVYITSLFSTPESGDMTLSEYVAVVTEHVGRAPDKILVNNTHPDHKAIKLYAADGQHPLLDDLGKGSSVVRADLLEQGIRARNKADAVHRSLVRHDGQKLAAVIARL